MDKAIRVFLDDLAAKMPSEDPYDCEDPSELYCGNEDDARTMGEEHVLYVVGKRAKDLLGAAPVVVEKVPLKCAECGEYHTGEEMERFYAAGGKGDCPNA